MKLTKEEAEAYEKEGKIGAIRLMRYRTGLGLVETKWAVEEWLRTGKQIEDADPNTRNEKLKIENMALEKASEASLGLRKANETIHAQRLKAIQICYDVMGREESEIWKRACSVIAEEIKKGLV